MSGSRLVRPDAPEPPVLVVDDDEDQRDALANILQIRGYTSVQVPCGADALAHLRSAKACVIILDERLPDMTGAELREQLKRDPELARIPVIIFSGADSERHDDVVAYVRKGDDPERLLEVVDKACGKRG